MQHRAVSDRRVGAAVLVLGTLWINAPRGGSAGDAAKAPARGGGQALPGGAFRALIPGGEGEMVRQVLEVGMVGELAR